MDLEIEAENREFGNLKALETVYTEKQVDFIFIVRYFSPLKAEVVKFGIHATLRG